MAVNGKTDVEIEMFWKEKRQEVEVLLVKHWEQDTITAIIPYSHIVPIL